MCNLHEPNASSLISYLTGGQPTYLGKPLVSILTALGDGVSDIVSCGLDDGVISLSDHNAAGRILSVISVSFSFPERILVEENSHPVRARRIIDGILKVSHDENLIRRAKDLRIRLPS
jgi:hypothetical protein